MNRGCPSSARPVLLGLWALGLCALVGCSGGPQLPKTYPVKGKVVMKGGKPWNMGAGCQITFQKADEPSVVAVGVIDKDGTFTLTTNMYGKEKAGAAEGEHTVMIDPPTPPGEALPQVINPYVVEQKYQVQPTDNNITITLPVNKINFATGGGG